MQNKLFDTVFETSLRLLLLLDELDADASADYIQAVDFMALYGKHFSVSDSSINGDNPYMFCEYASRRELVRAALNELVLQGHIFPTAAESGFLFRNTYDGHRLADSLDNDFSQKYRRTVEAILESIKEIEGGALIEKLNEHAREDVERLMR